MVGNKGHPAVPFQFLSNENSIGYIGNEDEKK